MHIADVDIFQVNTTFYQFTYRLWRTANQEDLLMWCSFADDVNGFFDREGANKRENSSRLTQSFHFFMFEPIFSPVNALNQPI